MFGDHQRASSPAPEELTADRRRAPGPESRSPAHVYQSYARPKVVTLLGMQRSVGNAAVARLIQRDKAEEAAAVSTEQFNVQCWPFGDSKGPERKAYEDAQSKLNEFSGKKHPPVPKVFSPSTGGHFRVQLDPRAKRLDISVKCRFEFLDDGPARIDPEEMKMATAEGRAPAMIREAWTLEAKQEWKRKFLLEVNADWSNNFDYYCHKDWWESLNVPAMIRFYEVPETEGGGPDLGVIVHKGDTNLMINTVKLGGGRMEVNESVVEDRGGATAVHEAGHVLGLGDEYAEGAPEGKGADHSGLVEAEFGHKVIRGKGDPDSIMANGVKILPEHGVTFLEAIRDITGMQEWHMKPKVPPMPVPQ
jgi:hypothetical protein